MQLQTTSDDKDKDTENLNEKNKQQQNLISKNNLITYEKEKEINFTDLIFDRNSLKYSTFQLVKDCLIFSFCFFNKSNSFTKFRIKLNKIYSNCLSIETFIENKEMNKNCCQKYNNTEEKNNQENEK